MPAAFSSSCRSPRTCEIDKSSALTLTECGIKNAVDPRGLAPVAPAYATHVEPVDVSHELLNVYCINYVAHRKKARKKETNLQEAKKGLNSKSK